MQIDWLRTFLAVVDHGGFGAAATAIFRAQSRVSAHIASLEEELGATLIDRRTRPVSLTDAGQAFLPHARSIVTRVEASQADLSAVQGLVKGHVALGTYPSVSAAFLPPIISQFRKRYPGIRFDLIELPLEGIDSVLATSRVDLAFRPTIPAIDLASARKVILWQESLQFVLPIEHPHAQGASPITFDRLKDESFITTTDAIHANQPYSGLLSRHRVAFITDHPQTLISFVKAGLGIGMTNQLALLESNREDVKIREVCHPDAVRQVGLYWNTQHYRSAAAEALYSAIVDAPTPCGTHPAQRRL